MDEQYNDEAIAKTQLEADRSSGGGRPPKKTAIGLGDGSSGPGPYDVGQKLECQIIDARDGGYDVMILKGGVRAFLKTSKKYTPGFVLIGEFRYWQDVN